MSTKASASRQEAIRACLWILVLFGLYLGGRALRSDWLLLSAVLVGVPAILASGYFALGQLEEKPRNIAGFVAGLCLTSVALGVPCMILVYPVYQQVEDAQARSQLSDRMKQIGLAMHEYHDAHKRLPAHAIYSKDGQPLLSWRVALLPYLGHGDLYRQFKLDERWDSPHNLPLAKKMPEVYALPRWLRDGQPSNTTCFQVFVGPGAAFEGNVAVSIRDFPDGTSNTLLVAVAEQPVVWTQPTDMEFHPRGPVPQLRSLSAKYPQWFVVTADGSSRYLPAAITDEELRGLITRNGGEPPPKDW
jgi:hypothetical protein